MKEICTSLKIYGEGASKYMTTHGLRATLISLLIASGHSDASVVLRSGHRDSMSLQSYHNLRGRNGRNQMIAIVPNRESKEDLTALRKCDYPIELAELEKTLSLQNNKKLYAGTSSPGNLASSAGKFSEERSCETCQMRKREEGSCETSLRTIFGAAVHASNCNIKMDITHKWSSGSQPFREWRG